MDPKVGMPDRWSEGHRLECIVYYARHLPVDQTNNETVQQTRLENLCETTRDNTLSHC